MGAVAGMVVSLSLPGCGGATQQPREAPLSYQHLKAIQRAYLLALRELQRPPENAKEILPYLHFEGDGGPQALLRSPDDGEEYKIFWGIDPLQPRQGDDKLPILAHEQRGKDGMRYVMDAVGVYRKTDEEFAQLPMPAGNRAQP